MDISQKNRNISINSKIHSRQSPDKFTTRHPSQPVQSSHHSMPIIIKQSINDVQKMSIELLSIVNRIGASSHNIHSSSNNLFVQNVQKNLKIKFQELFQLVQSLYRNMQQRVSSYVSMVNSMQKHRSSDVHPNLVQVTRMTLEDNRYEFLNDKIKTLQSSLGETKQNETRLLEIIQKLIQKYQIPESSSFLQAESGYHQTRQRQRATTLNSINKLPILSQQEQYPSQYSTQISGFHNKNNIALNNQKKSSDVQSIYHKLYNDSQCKFNHQEQRQNKKQPGHFRLRQIQQNSGDQIFIKKLYSKQQSNFSGGLTDSKKSLKMDMKSSSSSNSRVTGKNSKDMHSTRSNDDKQHRMQFMIGNLKP